MLIREHLESGELDYLPCRRGGSDRVAFGCLRVLELLELFRIGELRGVDFYLRRLAHIDDGERGLDCGHQVGNVISAAAKNFALGLRWGSFSDTANNRPSAH
jgi:hypothetical protein